MLLNCDGPLVIANASKSVKVSNTDTKFRLSKIILC